MQAVLDFIKANWALVLLAVKSLADLAFAINPSLDAPGGVVDAAYLWIKKLVSK